MKIRLFDVWIFIVWLIGFGAASWIGMDIISSSPLNAYVKEKTGFEDLAFFAVVAGFTFLFLGGVGYYRITKQYQFLEGSKKEKISQPPSTRQVIPLWNPYSVINWMLFGLVFATIPLTSAFIITSLWFENKFIFSLGYLASIAYLFYMSKRTKDYRRVSSALNMFTWIFTLFSIILFIFLWS